MSPKRKLISGVVSLTAFVLLLAVVMHGHNIDVLNPQGQIAEKQRNLMIFGTLLSLIVVLPVFALTGYIAWTYREGNKKAKYTPEWDSSAKLETIWWGIPLILITILSVVTWNSSYALSPHKPIVSATKPLTVQVVALDWKWLFIYPDQNIATVNYVQFPVGTPVNFQITSDAPMNSFWIPSLGGQIYAMSGMSTHLNLIADEAGSYNGSSANISGKGFAGMKFTAQATSQGEFDRWVNTARESPHALNGETYAQLAKQSINDPVAYFSTVENYFYESVVTKFMLPTKTYSHEEGRE